MLKHKIFNPCEEYNLKVKLKTDDLITDVSVYRMEA